MGITLQNANMKRLYVEITWRPRERVARCNIFMIPNPLAAIVKGELPQTGPVIALSFTLQNAEMSSNLKTMNLRMRTCCDCGQETVGKKHSVGEQC